MLRIDLKLKLIVMSLNIDNQTKVEVEFSRLEAIYEKAQDVGVLCKDYALELCLCDADFMRQHNRDFRGLDEKTDVLSFVMSPVSGSLLVCLEYLLARSGKKGLEEDLQAVFAHGICHLAGCDHLTAAQTRQMQTKEDLLLKR